MTALDLPPSDTTPHVHFDEASSTLRFEGESYPENVSQFYEPIFSWLRELLAGKPKLKVILAFTYLNTSSTKALLDFLLQLDEYHRSGGTVEVEWHFRPSIEVMQEAGEEFGEDLSLPYRLVPV